MAVRETWKEGFGVKNHFGVLICIFFVLGGAQVSDALTPQCVQGNLVATPEPGTMLLLGLGLIGIGIVMRELF